MSKELTKSEAIQQMVDRDFSSIPQEWVQIVAEKKGEYPTLPMWGWLWFVDEFYGRKFMENSRLMVGDASEIDLEAIEDKPEREEVKTAIEDSEKESIAWGSVHILEKYIDEEMSGANCILDKDGNTTAAYIYEIDGLYLVGVNGAGWNFYHGVWDKLYDLQGLQWHELIECPSCKEEKLSVNEARNALSRKDNKTYICNDCGTAEAMEDYEKSKK